MLGKLILLAPAKIDVLARFLTLKSIFLDEKIKIFDGNPSKIFIINVFEKVEPKKRSKNST